MALSSHRYFISILLCIALYKSLFGECMRERESVCVCVREFVEGFSLVCVAYKQLFVLCLCHQGRGCSIEGANAWSL